ncbi:hypothetical protein M2650_05685 [Luteimonas sp. SX5]|uniref:Uncharacterized protein n=1 Tax=Luteimonas galliterrae TaxID=2940486 RepID=A0ABT0MGX6_9GAMM|nr:hypothetical protein [Luteimonas galliterrae]MCL1634122.1 hypothetical protein [Luteimonas galliterrae]
MMILVGAEALLLALGLLKLWLTGVKSDAAGQGMAYAYVAIGTILALLLMAPAFAMAYYGKLPWLALALAVIAALFVLIVVVGALVG